VTVRRKPILIYITGYPGSGKTTFANALMDALLSSGARSIDRFSDKDQLLKSSWLEKGLWLCQNLLLVLRATLLIKRTAKGRTGLATDARSVLRACRIVLCQLALKRAADKDCPAIIVADETPVHRLWTALFPAKGTASLQSLDLVVNSLLSNQVLPCKIVFIWLPTSQALCAERFAGRALVTSRFNAGTDQSLIADFLTDKVYANIHAAARRASNPQICFPATARQSDLLAHIVRKVAGS
jgi:hypothetical protein